MKHEIVQLAQRIRSIYEKASHEDFSLFMGSFEFPKNSCEGASRVFAHIVKSKHPECDVKVIEGYDYPNDERHYWVVVNELIYDLTSDQFDEFSVPLFGVNYTPLSEKFSDLEFIINEDIFHNWSPGGRYDKNQTLDYVEHHLALL
ncbi:hypothetical protein A1OO_08715 [Enterovibrio norvegicus FF-33]|uniref:hypothetical protein n=1 Tax=Enterovibrio norvegicus TaxID=188144 RepID=UPI0003823465|nr:hypothetical protein [Enterovibrio norvegicus]OEE65881.1 hypothetical protein A1OO_08715 [Enterovibrio norvegicus FF-33]